MGNKPNYPELVRDAFLTNQYGLRSMEVFNYVPTMHFIGGIHHFPEMQVKIEVRGYGGADCTATFRGPYMWRNCYKFIKAAYKHL